MKKQYLFLLTTFLTINCYSQISFERGYYIDTQNQKTNCLIKNVDWNNNPTQFEYKLSEKSESKNATIKTVIEFGINNAKYLRKRVNIDRSSNSINNLSNSKNPIFKEEELFLKVLVEGKSNLYEYVDDNLRRYFYSKDNSEIIQLIFKRYKNIENNVAKNNRFRQQLWVNLKCSNFTMSKIESIDYIKSDLIRFFTEYSECHNTDLSIYKPKQKRNLYNLTIRPRLNSSSLNIQSYLPYIRDIDFENKTGFGIGLEAEFIFPFNKNKWSIVIEPTYQSYKSKKTSIINNASEGILISEVNYSS
ncbi:MAG: tRNA modification GTPase, partial [Arcobacter sp.]|nr:tRNA modification GTPase [Arcobacter sp.]